MEHRQSTEQQTLAGELPVAHVRVDIPVLDGDPLLGFSIRGVDLEGGLVFQLSWSRGAFPTIPDMLDVLARELLDLFQRSTVTLQ